MSIRRAKTVERRHWDTSPAHRSLLNVGRSRDCRPGRTALRCNQIGRHMVQLRFATTLTKWEARGGIAIPQL